MPRSKKAAARGRGRGAAVSRGGRDGDGIGSLVPFEAHSLQSEVLLTQRHQSSGHSPGQSLRHTKVMFVSAGGPETSDIEEPETVLAHMTLKEDSSSPPCIEVDSKLRLHSNTDKLFPDQDQRSSRNLLEPNDAFFADPQGGNPVDTGLSLPQIRSISPTISSSSDEVILFAGRDTAGRCLSKATKANSGNIKVEPYDSIIRIIDDKIHENLRLLAMKAPHVEQSSSAQPTTENNFSPVNGSMQCALPLPCQQTKAFMSEADEISVRSYRRGQKRYIPKSNREQEQALIDDYISNIEAHDMSPDLSLNQRDLGGTDTDTWQATETSGIGRQKAVYSHEWDRSGSADSDVMSTSDEVLGSARAILSKRSRNNGVQYLVVWDHHSVEETRWVPSASLRDIKSSKLVAQFEAEKNSPAEISNENDHIDLSTDTDPTGAEDFNTTKDDTDLLSSRMKYMTDENIAKLLAKQEELGMGSSELVLLDDSLGSNLDDGHTRTHHIDEPTRHGLQIVLNGKQAEGDFPSASALADAYDGFDVMDFERASLKKKLKGRKGRLAFDLSDSEDEEYISVAWDKDRSKKRDRKEERQALRLQGLLGKKETKPDLKAKYKEGIGLHAVMEEIKSFLMSENTTLSLPPMDKADRKAVHELANAFNLKSKSIGNGNKRFPVLYRTQRTSSFSETKFSAIETRLTRRYLPRMDLRGRNSISVSKRSGRGGANNAAVRYRDGDVVGGSAPELGLENKGRAMLEKMGWSTGTALGALNNKGILQPVSHIVKTTKAGLG